MEPRIKHKSSISELEKKANKYWDNWLETKSDFWLDAYKQTSRILQAKLAEIEKTKGGNK